MLDTEPEDIQYKYQKRLEGLQRLSFYLSLLIENTHFVIGSAYSPMVNVWLNCIDRIRQVEYYNVYNIDQNDIAKTNEIYIEERQFYKVLKYLREVKKEYNIVLNKANLIFREGDEVNLNALQEELIRGG